MFLNFFSRILVPSDSDPEVEKCHFISLLCSEFWGNFVCFADGS